MKHYLYRHIRLDKNEPFYIGIGTKSDREHPNERSEYRRAFEKNRKESHIWNKIVNKTDYIIEILLESKDYSFIKNKEKEFIILYGRINKKTGCLANLTDGGDGFIGYVPTKETIEKHRMFMIGRIQSEAEKQKRIDSRKGYKHSLETKQKISNSHKGKKVSKEHLSKLHKGQIIAQSKPVEQYDIDGNFIKSWESATIAGRTLNAHPTSIRHCVRGITKTSHGFIWKPKISYK